MTILLSLSYMNYTKGDVARMTWHEWNATMAKELNDAGFLGYGFNPQTKRIEKNQAPYNADPTSPSSFINGAVDTAPEIDYLKNIGLLNNGRCPMCGEPIYGEPGRFTSGFDYNMHFQICQECVSSKGGTKILRRQLGLIGCVISLILLPIQIVLLPIRFIVSLLKKR